MQIRALSKRFGALAALEGVELDGQRGEVLALTGANGAGKSTLMNLLAGVYEPSAGEIRIDGQPARFRSPGHARAAGVSAVYQELCVLPELSVAENIWLGQEPRTRFGLLDRAAMHERTHSVLQTWKLPLEPAALAGTLSVATRQLVEIARALATKARILTLDEPTAVLSGEERCRLFRIIRELRQRGLLIIFVSHRLDEVFEIADRIVVLRNGRLVHHGPARGLDRSALVQHMVGHEVIERSAPGAPGTGSAPGGAQGPAPVVSVRIVEGAAANKLEHEFELRPAEVIGLGGLVGAGRTRLARRLAGLEGQEQGFEVTWRIAGQSHALRSAADALRLGIVYLTEDRKRDGLFDNLSVLANATAAALPRLSRCGFVSRHRERALATPVLQRLRVVAASLKMPVRGLSGGNQQKMLFARALLARPAVLICDEPTRGVDVGAREEIFCLIEALARDGVAIVLICSDLKELLGCCHRIWVVREARVVAELPAGASELDIVEAAVAR